MPLKPILVLTWDILIVITIKIRSTIGTKENCTFVYESRFAKFGNFSSINWPFKYPNNIRCFYYFRGEPFEAINITFLSFDLESPFPKGCLSDYIDISTITAFNVKRLVGRYCGSKVPLPILSMHPRAEIIFRTNHVTGKQGFFGFYEFVDEGLIGPPVRQEKSCGGDEKGFGGIISSPNYPNSFPKSIDCMWLIRVQQHQHIYLRIMQLQLFGSIANCKDAHLAIYDGYENYDYEHHEPKKYCGDLKYYKSLDDKVQLSANNRLLIRFKSDITAPQWEEQVATQEITGFKLIWTAVTFKPKADCHHFLCSKSEFCLTPSSGSTCKRKEYFCIDKSLKCDGIPNCSEQDSSDEDNCNVSNRLYLIVSIVGLICIIFGLICLLYCRRRSLYSSEGGRSSSAHQSMSQNGLHHGSGSSAFTLKTTSDGSISVKYLNHSPQSSSYVLVDANGGDHETPSSPPSELLLPLETFYRSSNQQQLYHQLTNKSTHNNNEHHHHRSTTVLTPQDEANFTSLLLSSSSVPMVNNHTGSLRTPRHQSNKYQQSIQPTKPLSASSLGNIIASSTPPSIGKVNCSIHGQRSFQVPLPPPPILHDNTFYTLGKPRDQTKS